MGAYIVQTGSYRIKVQAGKGIRKNQNDYHLHLNELALYKAMATVRDAIEAVVVKITDKYIAYKAEQLKRELDEYPPHTIFCECKEVCMPRQWIFRKSRKAGRK